MIRPVITADEAVKVPIATPPAYAPNAMPTLAAEAGSEDASRPPGPAKPPRGTATITVRAAFWSANRPPANEPTAASRPRAVRRCPARTFPRTAWPERGSSCPDLALPAEYLSASSCSISRNPSHRCCRGSSDGPSDLDVDMWLPHDLSSPCAGRPASSALIAVAAVLGPGRPCEQTVTALRCESQP
jgi:hypothetical protein